MSSFVKPDLPSGKHSSLGKVAGAGSVSPCSNSENEVAFNAAQTKHKSYAGKIYYGSKSSASAYQSRVTGAIILSRQSLIHRYAKPLPPRFGALQTLFPHAFPRQRKAKSSQFAAFFKSLCDGFGRHVNFFQCILSDI